MGEEVVDVVARGRVCRPAPIAVVALLALMAAPGVAAPVNLADPDLPGGVRYAMAQLRGATSAPVTASLGADALLARCRSEEAFALVPRRDGFHVAARTHAGLMYGLLELRDRLAAGERPRKACVSAPALRLRGDVLDSPFYLGVDLYEGRWRHARDIEGSAQTWWLDRGHWAWRLRRCAELRINALLVCHPHPFPALVELPGMPEAAYFPPDHLRRLQEHFRWILSEAAAYGVRVYLLTWNIWVSPGFARAHGVAQEGADNALVRVYTRTCYRQLFETYPDLAGVMTMSGEAPPGCVDFVADAIVGGLNELARPPELLYWIWCSYPEDARRIFRQYRGRAALVHYLQYEQLFRPQADPRIQRASRALGGVPVVTVGGLGTATGWLYWSDPYYIRDIVADLPRRGGDGCFFQGLDSFDWVADKWLGWQGLARYWWSPRPGREDRYWQTRLARHYGLPRRASADLFDAAIASSSIPTRLLALLHRQTDHHTPQFGFPLVHYLGLPTLSTYVFENHDSIDAEGRLSPRLGLTWPNPDWGERVIGVVDYVGGKRSGTTPLQIADELERHARRVLARLAALRNVHPTEAEPARKWAGLLGQMEMCAHLGIHTGQKIRAAVAWERWRRGRAGRADVLRPLAESVRAMQRMAEVGGGLYAGIPIYHYRVCVSRPVPWTHKQIWTSDRWRRHDWSHSAAMFQRELEWVEREMEGRSPQPLLPFEDDLAPPPANARLLLSWDCEGDPPAGLKLNHIGPEASAVAGPGQAPAPLAGRRIVAALRNDGFYFPVTTDPARLPLEVGRHYRVTLDYWILEDAEDQGEWLSAGARTTKGGWQNDVGARYMGGPAGTRGRFTLSFTPRTWRDYYVYVSLHGRCKVELDNLEIWVGDPPSP